MRKTTILLLTFLFIYNLSAQVIPPSRMLTLDDCLAIAERNNFDIKLANAKTKASGADITAAFGNFLPSLSTNLGYTRSYASYFQRVDTNLQLAKKWNNYYNMAAEADLMLFNGFSREAKYSQAQSNYEANYLSALHSAKKTKLTVYQQYNDIIKKMQIVKLRRENLDLGKQILEQIKSKNEIGTSSIDFVYAQEADLGNKEFDLITSENDVNVAKSNLLSTMGLAPDADVEFMESSLPNQINDDDLKTFRLNYSNPTSVTNIAFTNRLDVQSIKNNLDAANSQLISQRAGYYPTISAGYRWTWGNQALTDFNQSNSAIGLTFSFPLFDNFKTNNNIEQAKLQIQQVEIQKSQLDQMIRTTIKISFLNLDAAEKQLDVTKRALRSAELNFQAASEKFRIGKAGIIDYQTANMQYITAQINRVSAVYTYIQSQKEVLYAIGKL